MFNDINLLNVANGSKSHPFDMKLRQVKTECGIIKREEERARGMD